MDWELIQGKKNIEFGMGLQEHVGVVDEEGSKSRLRFLKRVVGHQNL